MKSISTVLVILIGMLGLIASAMYCVGNPGLFLAAVSCVVIVVGIAGFLCMLRNEIQEVAADLKPMISVNRATEPSRKATN